MKKIVLFLTIFILSNSTSTYSQVVDSGSGEYKFNPQKAECISDLQRTEIQNSLARNKKELEMQGILQTNLNRQNPSAHPLFIWPVTKNPTATYNNVWSISNHIDHNLSYPNLVQDYNCGNRTYDTSGGYNHKGIDIFTWPFSWYQFQNNQSWAIAAADGIIIGKYDGNFDMNCSLSGGNWNAVYIQHADGSVAWYGHLKNNSLTSKSLGDTVVAGEFLGVIGSSGNSTGPHLHFEVYNSSNQLVDTYIGTCNTWSSRNDSWWLLQKPYQDPKINAVLTHTAVPVFNACPTTETTYLSNSFTNGSSVVGEIYLADQVVGTSGTLTLYRPNGTIAYTTNNNITTFYQASYWYWTFSAATFNVNGTWTLSYTYNGNTVSNQFNYGALSNDNFLKNQFSIFPNPTNSILNIRLINNDLDIKNISIFDLTGKKIFNQNHFTQTIDVSNLSNGLYLIEIETNEENYKGKIIKR
jgi:murein DD-endopeptidase MepM/ murein hydrolase activator NlpD